MFFLRLVSETKQQNNRSKILVDQGQTSTNTSPGSTSHLFASRPASFCVHRRMFCLPPLRKVKAPVAGGAISDVLSQIPQDPPSGKTTAVCRFPLGSPYYLSTRSDDLPFKYPFAASPNCTRHTEQASEISGEASFSKCERPASASGEAFRKKGFCLSIER